MLNIHSKQIVVLSQSLLLIESIKDNFPFQIQNISADFSINYIASNDSNSINYYDKIDLLITDFKPKNFEDWYKINIIANLDNNNKISADEISFLKPLKLNNLFKVIKKTIDNNSVFCTINDYFIYNESTQSISSNKKLTTLTEKENKIFKFILLSGNFTAEKESLLKQVWQYNENSESSTVDTHLYKLKAKLPDNMLKIKNNIYQLSIDTK